MKKQDLVKMLAEKMETSQVKANDILKTVFNTIEEVMVAGDDVSIPKFGKFSTKINAARTYRNPQTGDPMDVEAKRVPKFKASSVLKGNILE